MAIYLPKTDALILLVPKSGSRWIEAAVREAKIDFEAIGPTELRGHGDLSVHGRNFSFICCFVRNPVEWYRSYWAYRNRTGWETIFPIDTICNNSCFSTFVERATSFLPGYVTRMYAMFAGSLRDPVDFVGKQENLKVDFLTALALAGEHVNEEVIRSIPVINATEEKPEYTPELLRSVTASEREGLIRYKYDIDLPKP